MFIFKQYRNQFMKDTLVRLIKHTTLSLFSQFNVMRLLKHITRKSLLYL